MHNHHAHEPAGGLGIDLLPLLPFLLFIGLYLFAVIWSNRKHRKWPLYRSVFWVAGVVFAAAAVTGPIATLAHTDFTAHMLGHLLLGMLAPLLLVLSAPVTLLLRTLNVQTARKVTKVLQLRIFSFFTDPAVASILNIGGLWVLYTTNLYHAMHDSMLLHSLIHFHVFAAGYLFTISLIYIDPTPHRRSYVYRMIVFIFALAGHGILSKYIYANPPAGVPSSQAESGGMLMYYGGDAIDIMIIIILCYQWYKATRPKTSQVLAHQNSGAY
ncbi:cytochrome c oxidase assembly protein [Jeotgalibacillus proteolyticus]|uniref:Cytochrome c oxidase assembly protein n=1 Tax=Jeotgalibacillus proteolyticus TaxID=2082395 RepID=A0A2S5GDJ7_9BACL|nr:cytochrome c oxidase assembly protein [Jeotgalibacillus proteolyticus]PPA70995.1 cytochrome c oxidase assembly protein [Jeotgalibacillus proteolyticus]